MMADAIFVILLVDKPLNSFDNVVNLAVLELGKFPVLRKIVEGVEDDLALTHKIQQLGIVIPIPLPSPIRNDPVQRCQPVAQPDFGVTVKVEIKLRVLYHLPDCYVLQILLVDYLQNTL